MQRDMLRTAKRLYERGHQVDIFTLSWQGELPAGIAVHLLPQRGWFNYRRYQQFIAATFKRIDASHYDYIVGYNRMPRLDAHFAADPCFVARMQQRLPIARLTPRYRWFAACEKAVFAEGVNTQILTVSLAEKTQFQHWYHTAEARFHFIPPYLSAERFVLQPKAAMRRYLRQAFAFDEADFVYLLTGSGFAMKGLDRAILALAALPDALRHHTKLVAVGQDNPKHFLAMAKKHQVADHVVIAKGRADIPQLMQGADVCVHPAYRENTGLVILEGMACGTPMLVTESCGYAQHVATAGAGLVQPLPFLQIAFNAQWLAMRTASADQRAQWSDNGLRYAQQLMRENDGSAEADVLISLATAKVNHETVLVHSA